MQKKTCPNGHVYDTSIYGDQCPLCPPGAAAGGGGSPKTHLGGAASASMPGGMGAMHTQIGGGSTPPPMPGGNYSAPTQPIGLGAQASAPGADLSGATRMRPDGAAPAGGHTVIRHAAKPGTSSPQAPIRKLVGFLVTYNRDPQGRAFNLYEGRNYIGRDASCDISLPDDNQMSGRHMSILYRNVDHKFKFRDEQSSNGTFINKELLDDGELQDGDIIRAGSTLFIFMAIPNIFN